MRSIELDELKNLQLQILNTVADFCKKNGINYWLDCGTLIGAVRHKGYIPWDDDIDIGMLRPDYDKFLAMFNTANNRYKAYSIENNEDFLYPFCKVVDTSTVLYEPDEKGLKLCVNIDVFVYDNAPDDEAALRKMYKKRDLFRGLHNIRTRLFACSKSGLKKAIKWIMYPILCLFPKNYFAKKMIKNSKKFKESKTKFIGNFTSITKIRCAKELFSEFIPVEFEGKLYNAPIGYDSWLKTFYGDYMVLPPEEKRKPHHYFKAFMLEECDIK